MIPRRTVVTLICVNRRRVLIHHASFLPPSLAGCKGRWPLKNICQAVGLDPRVLNRGSLKFLGHACHFFGDEAKEISPGQATLCLYGVNVRELPLSDGYISVALDDERLPEPIRQAIQSFQSCRVTNDNPLTSTLARIFTRDGRVSQTVRGRSN